MEHQASRPQVVGWKRDLVVWIDHRVYSLSKHWLVVFNALIGLYVLLPILAPILMVSGAAPLGRAIYIVYRPACHQLPERSFFLFGPQAVYSLDELWALGVVSGEDNIFSRQGILGTPEIGFKLALCQRDMALYGGLLVGGLLFGLVRKRLQPLKWWIFGLFLVPMAVDGGTQLLFLRESTWFLRVITGGLVGVGAVWLLYPYLETAFAEIREQVSDRLFPQASRGDPVARR
jgi:uncharacterized membrane protein